MHRSEADRLLPCNACGQETGGAADRGFSGGGDTVLCYDCSVRRGGTWDEAENRWTREPDTADLGLGGPAER